MAQEIDRHNKKWCQEIIDERTKENSTRTSRDRLMNTEKEIEMPQGLRLVRNVLVYEQVTER